MAAKIVFVDEGTIDEVVGGEDSDLDENTDNSESSEEEDYRREEDGDGEADSEEETEEDNWVLGDRIPRRLDFTADRGLNVELPNNPSFSDYFHLLFPENLFDEIASQTNKYPSKTIASLQRRGRLPQHSRFRNWPEDGVTAGEMKAFLAMIITMGLVNQENIQDYWSTDEVLSTPFFSQIRSRDKFNIFSLV